MKRHHTSNETESVNKQSLHLASAETATVLRSVVWPMISEKDAINTMKCNSDLYYTMLYKYPVRAVLSIDMINMYRNIKPIITRMKISTLRYLQTSLPFITSSQTYSLSHLAFDAIFNERIDANVLPSSLTQLTFHRRSHFNQPLAVGVLPSSLTQLVFGYCFDQPLAVGVLPSSLTQLTLGDSSARSGCDTILADSAYIG